jgi:hypothetical protein
MILPVFQIDGIMQWANEKLAIFVRVVIPSGPRCLRWMFEMLYGPMAEEFLSCFMTREVSDAVARM